MVLGTLTPSTAMEPLISRPEEVDDVCPALDEDYVVGAVLMSGVAVSLSRP